MVFTGFILAFEALNITIFSATQTTYFTTLVTRLPMPTIRLPTLATSLQHAYLSIHPQIPDAAFQWVGLDGLWPPVCGV